MSADRPESPPESPPARAPTGQTSAAVPAALPTAALRRRCDPATIPFDSSDGAEPLDQPPGQARALAALDFGVCMRREGYNLFLLGSPGLGKRRLAERLIGACAGRQRVPDDCCYVNNFDDPSRPLVLRLPAGRAAPLRADIDALLGDLLVAMPAAFQSDEYRGRAQAIHDAFEERRQSAFGDLDERARQRGALLIPTPSGYTLAPKRDGQPMSGEEFAGLDAAERERIETAIDALKDELKALVRRLPGWQREAMERLRQLNREYAQGTADQLFAELVARYGDLPEVLEHIERLRADVVDNMDGFLSDGPGNGQPGAPPRGASVELARYTVNLLVDNAAARGAPLVVEEHPSYQNLLGRVEHIAEYGALTTNFTLIKPGALHRANGGYLVLDAARLLTSPYSWPALKRTLRARELRIESLERVLGMASTVSLEPQPIPLDVKVVLVGERVLYHLLRAYDPEFSLLFKVQADFAEDCPRDAEHTALYARMIASLAREEGARPLDRGAVARLIESAARSAGDGEKLSLHVGGLRDLLVEAEYFAARDRGDGAARLVRATHVDAALEARRERTGAHRERVQELIHRGTLMIDAAGARAGQVNGLAVLALGEGSFGHPVRITATARFGGGKLLDIERESELGGPIHSKGVLILSSFLAERYAADRPLRLTASLVFEQSYAGVDGDSASLAELCALVSALAGVPLRQSLALTGSINQHGEVQPIGGVNEKIEGFFEVCRARGLDGEQGVLIPAANLPHLMLRDEVVEACAAGHFSVRALRHVDEALALLSGLPVGAADGDGRYPADSINGRVLARLDAWAERHAVEQHGAAGGKAAGGGGGDVD